MNQNGTDSQECEYELARQKEINRQLDHLEQVRQHDAAEIARQQRLSNLPPGDQLTGHEIERQRLEMELLLHWKSYHKPRHSLMDDLKTWRAEFNISNDAWTALMSLLRIVL